MIADTGMMVSGTFRHRSKAFTLIELMMVMAILGTVGGIAAFRATTTVRRLEYNSYVQRCHAFLARARNKAIMENTVQRVVVKPGPGRLIRYSQRLLLNPPRYEEVLAEELVLPSNICTLKEDTRDKGRGGPLAYSFLPDGLGDELRHLSLRIVQGEALGNRKKYFLLTRNGRGQVLLKGPLSP